MTTKQFVLLGPQGSGKGTQAKVLAARLGIPHISTGDMFRDNISRGMSLGTQAKAFMDKGALVPDELTNEMVKERLQRADAQAGFVLDGYPRNVVQADFLHAIIPQVRAIVLELSDPEAVARIAGRRTCSKCGAIYHLQFDPPKVLGLCDKCGGELTQRTDDVEAAVRRRLAAYHQETEPLVAYYHARHALIEIDGTPPIGEVSQNIAQVLEL